MMSIVLRFAWKEYRVLRGYFLVLAALTLAGQYFAVQLYDPMEIEDVLIVAAISASCLFALGVGAVLYATEREENTDEFLQGLPLTNWQVLVGKTFFAILAIPSISLLVWTIPAWRLPSEMVRLGFFFATGLPVLLVYLLSAVASLKLRNPLKAAVLGGSLFAITTPWMAFAYTYGLERHGSPIEFAWVLAAVGVAGCCLHLLLGRHWLYPGMRHGRAHKWSPHTATDRMRPDTRRLLWQSARQSGMLQLLIIAVAVSLVVLGLSFSSGRAQSYGGTTIMLLAISLIAANLLGSTTFLADQETKQFQFFAQHGIRARHVWRSRQVWTGGIAICFSLGAMSVFIVAFGGAFARSDSTETGPPEIHLPALMVAYILALACGQCCSMIFRSGVVAAFFGLVLLALSGGWLALTSLWYELNPYWSVLPMAIALFVSTWYRAPGWVVEHNGTGQWLRVVGIVLLPTVVTIACVAGVRVFEVPSVSPGFDLASLAAKRTPEERATARMYLEAAAHTAGDTQLNMIREATARDECAFLDVGQYDYEIIGRLARLTSPLEKSDELRDWIAMLRMCNHMRSKSNGWLYSHADAYEARLLKKLTQHTGAPGRDTQFIDAATDALLATFQQRPSRLAAVQFDYLFRQKIWEGDLDRLALLYPDGLKQFAIQSRLLPWEKYRANRLLRLATQRAVREVETWEADAKAGSTRQYFIAYELLGENGRTLTIRQIDVERWFRTSLHAPRLIDDSRGQIFNQERQMETRRRAALTILAIQRHKLVHGELPEKLPADAPLDPYTGQPFRYSRRGNPTSTVWQTSERNQISLPERVPYIWSPTAWRADLYDVDGTGDTEERGWPFRIHAVKYVRNW